MKLLIEIRELGVKITDQTPKAEVERYASKYPIVKQLLDKLYGKKEKDGGK